MAKVSIGLRGWRFDEDDVFADDGTMRPLEEMPPDTRDRIQRLMVLVREPCDACWLIHGDDNRDQCNVPDVVYGEPLSEVLLCSDHEADFLYWYREEGGEAYRGEPELQDEFHEWFADGGRAPEGYGGIEHVDTDPQNVRTPPAPEFPTVDVEPTEDDAVRLDLRQFDDEPTEEADDKAGTPVDLDETEIDLDAEYPRR
ncbi:MAG: hypothetical protein ABEJ48_05745 [Halobacteriales archaeon]